eukprot:symbB.v1.2.013124.t1/scaffold923.1/size151761/7
MFSWEWPTVDTTWLGAIQESSSLSFLFDTTTWVDIDRGLGCSEAYEENSSTMKWVKVDSDSDNVPDTWQGLFGSDVLPTDLCDGVYDGHVVVTDVGITEAFAAAQTSSFALKVLIRDITGSSVENFEIREVVAAWKYQAPVWWPDDPDNCWTVNDSMTATDPCSCKDDCRCMPGCSEADCATDNDTLRSYTCAYAGKAVNMTARIQTKGSLRWLPEVWNCPGSTVATASYFADGVCDCGCARYDPDCAGVSGNPQAYADELETNGAEVRNYCSDEAAMLGADGWNYTVQSAGCQGYFHIPLDGTTTAPAPWLPRGICQ